MAAVWALGSWTATAEDGIATIRIQASPNVVSLTSNSEWMTIHADIPLATVKRDSLVLYCNDAKVTIDRIKSDALGQLVTKTKMTVLKAALSKTTPCKATLALEGVANGGVAFSGSVEVKVVSR
jgi:hypothetical protein